MTMHHEPSITNQHPLWFRWAQLVRLPTVFTILAQVTAAFWLSSGAVAAGELAWPRLLLVLAAAVCLYWAGMILNDVNDLEEDRQDRPSRPLPSGQIALSQASSIAWGLMGLSIGLAAASGHVGDRSALPATWLPAAVAVVLAVCVVLYDGPLKQTGLAPWVMGLCRGLVFLLGAAPLVSPGAAESSWLGLGFADHLWGAAAGFALFIVGITTISRREAGTQAGSPRLDVILGSLLALLGVALLAWAPRLAPETTLWRFLPDQRFLLLVGLVSLPLLIRIQRAIADPIAANIQNVVRFGILSIIPYSAILILLAAGQGWAIAIFLLGPLATLTAVRMRVT